jgi:hypothetical protein
MAHSPQPCQNQKVLATGHAPLLNATHSLRAETGSGDPIQVPGKGVSPSKRRGPPSLQDGAAVLRVPTKGS